MTRPVATTIGLTICALAGGSGCDPPIADPVLTVRIARVQRRDLRQAVTLSGRLAPKRYIEILAPAHSVVQDVFVTAGERVVQGQPVLRIESPPTGVQPSVALPLLERRTSAVRQSLETIDLALEAQGQALERDATELEAARFGIERLERLYTEGLLARLEFEREREKLNQLQLSVAARRRAFDQLRQDRSAVAENLAEAETREEVARSAQTQGATKHRTRTLNSPVAGYVTRVAAAGFMSIEESAASIALADGLTVQIEEDISIERGQPARIDTPEGSLAGATAGNGRIELDALPVRWFDGPLDVTLELPPKLSRPVVPVSALRPGGTVLVVLEGRLQLRTVDAGVVSEGYVEIESGLERGESVVLSPASDLAEGDRVVVDNGRN